MDKDTKKVINIYNITDLRSYLQTEKDIDYSRLVDGFRPINHDFSHNARVTPMFECILENIPNLWLKIKDFNNEIYLAEKVVGIINHYDKNEYWNIFVKKLGEQIKLYDKNEHKEMWTDAMLHFSPLIFPQYTLHKEIEKSIGKKELNDIFLNHIQDFSISCKWEVQSALEESSNEKLINLLKKYVEDENFYAALFIEENSEITKDEILKIKIKDVSIAEYLQAKREEYTLAITGYPVEKGSYEKIDKIFRKNLNKEGHDYRLNYFNLEKVMSGLELFKVENVESIENKKKKAKMK